MRSVLVEFEDGHKAVTDAYAVKLAPTGPPKQFGFGDY